MIKGWAELCHTRNYNKLKFDLRNIVNLFAKEEAIELDQLKETNNGRMSRAMSHSGLQSNQIRIDSIKLINLD